MKPSTQRTIYHLKKYTLDSVALGRPKKNHEVRRAWPELL